MPRNKRTAQEIEGHIHELVDDNLKRTKNVDLELKFQKYQREKNKLDAFHLKLDQKNMSTVEYIYIIWILVFNIT